MSKQPEPETFGFRYKIGVQEHIDIDWSEWFDGMTITSGTDGATVIEGIIADQSALYGLLAKLQNLNLSLISVQRLDSVQRDQNDGDEQAHKKKTKELGQHNASAGSMRRKPESLYAGLQRRVAARDSVRAAVSRVRGLPWPARRGVGRASPPPSPSHADHSDLVRCLKCGIWYTKGT